MFDGRFHSITFKYILYYIRKTYCNRVIVKGRVFLGKTRNTQIN